MVSTRRSQKTVSSEQNKDNIATTVDDACDNAPRAIQGQDVGNDLIEKSSTSRLSQSKKVGQEKESKRKIHPESDICTNDSSGAESSCEIKGFPALEDQAECSENDSYQIDTNTSESPALEDQEECSESENVSFQIDTNPSETPALEDQAECSESENVSFQIDTNPSETPALDDQAECSESENVSFQIETNPSEKSPTMLITETNSEGEEAVGNTNSDAVNSPLKFIIDSKSASEKPANVYVRRSTPKTVAELEEQIMGGSSDDNSDDEEFSFLNGGKCKVKDAPDADSGMFMIDRQAGNDIQTATSSTEPKAGHYIKEDIDPEHRHTIIQKYARPASEIHVEPEESYLDLGENAEKNLTKGTFKKKTKPAEPEAMKKAVIGGDFEQKHALPRYTEGKKALARKRLEEKNRTKKDWFDMKAPEMTEELEADIEALQMRGTIASYKGYRKNDYKNGSGPKFFQVATVQDSPVDFYHSRVVKKDRKRTIVDELLADAEFRKKNKKMYVKAVDKMNTRHPGKKGGRFNKTKRTK